MARHDYLPYTPIQNAPALSYQAAEPGLKAVKEFQKSPASGVNAAGDLTLAAGAIPGPQQPFVAGAGLVLKGVGLGIQAYGGYKQREAAEKAAEKSELRYQEELRRLEKLDEERKRQQELSNQLALGEYAQGYEEQAQQYYGQYR